MADREAPKSKGAGGKGQAKDSAPSQSKQQLAFDPNHTRGFYQRGTTASPRSTAGNEALGWSAWDATVQRVQSGTYADRDQLGGQRCLLVPKPELLVGTCSTS